jgi:hypothetical protein
MNCRRYPIKMLLMYVMHVNKGRVINILPRSQLDISKVPLELIFSDVWGPAPTSAGKHNYYVSFIDGFSKFIWIYLLQHKFEVL